MSLNFDFVLLRSGTFNTVAFGKLEALYFELNVFQNLKKPFQAFTCLMFLLNLLQLFWTECFSSTPAPEDTNIYVTFVLTRRGGVHFQHLNMGRSFIPIVEV